MKVVHMNLGAIDRTADMIIQQLDDGRPSFSPGRSSRPELR
jgi:hypothetical protein